MSALLAVSIGLSVLGGGGGWDHALGESLNHEQQEAVRTYVEARRVLEAKERAGRGQRRPAGGVLALRRACESGGDYGAVSKSGKYRGAYQFDQGSWNSAARAAKRPDLVGVDPARASVADQDAMAVVWERVHGGDPWPNCP